MPNFLAKLGDERTAVRDASFAQVIVVADDVRDTAAGNLDPADPVDIVGDLVGVAAVEDQRTVVEHVAEDAASRAPVSDLKGSARIGGADTIVIGAGQDDRVRRCALGERTRPCEGSGEGRARTCGIERAAANLERDDPPDENPPATLNSPPSKVRWPAVSPSRPSEATVMLPWLINVPPA